MADFELFRDYLLSGDSVLEQDRDRRAEQIRRSDANLDSLTLSLADFVFIARVIVGDELPRNRLPEPFRDRAEFSWRGDTLRVTSDKVDIGAVYLTFACDAEPTLTNLSGIDAIYNYEDGILKILVYSGEDDLTRKLEMGRRHELFEIVGNATLIDVQVSSYDGVMMLPRI